jgi:hypothetical protein
MARITRTAITGLIMALLGTPSLFAGIVVPQSPATLEREADLIVAGSATGVSKPDRPQSQHRGSHGPIRG